MKTREELAKFEAWIRDMPRASLAGLIKEYVAESNHGGWDGYQSRDLLGIARFFVDMRTYAEESESDFTGLSNVSPVE